MVIRPLESHAGGDRSVARIIREGGQPATTAFRVLSATPDADLSGHGTPALLVDPDTRSLPWTTLGASQAIPLRCAFYCTPWLLTVSLAGSAWHFAVGFRMVAFAIKRSRLPLSLRVDTGCFGDHC